jgi:hypothetical protein
MGRGTTTRTRRTLVATDPSPRTAARRTLAEAQPPQPGENPAGSDQLATEPVVLMSLAYGLLGICSAASWRRPKGTLKTDELIPMRRGAQFLAHAMRGIEGALSSTAVIDAQAADLAREAATASGLAAAGEPFIAQLRSFRRAVEAAATTGVLRFDDQADHHRIETFWRALFDITSALVSVPTDRVVSASSPE